MRKNIENSGWKQVSFETVFRTPVFSMKKERSRCLRTGAENDFYYFECVDWVNVIALDKESRLIMIKQFRHGSNQYEIEIPGGAIDATDANPVDAGIRELFEETGYVGKNARLIGQVCPNPALQGNLCYTVLIEEVEQKAAPDMEPTEDIETIPIPLKDVSDMIKSGIIRHGLVLNALHFFDLHKSK